MMEVTELILENLLALYFIFIRGPSPWGIRPGNSSSTSPPESPDSA